MAWGAQLGEGTWSAVLVPFGPMLVAPGSPWRRCARTRPSRSHARRPATLLAGNPLPIWTVRQLITPLGGSHEDHETHPASHRGRCRDRARAAAEWCIPGRAAAVGVGVALPPDDAAHDARHGSRRCR